MIFSRRKTASPQPQEVVVMKRSQQNLNRIAWATDIHLDHLDQKTMRTFYQELYDTQADVLLLGGDIIEASTLESHLKHMDMIVRFPVYFVLGNHDYYNGSITKVRDMVRAFSRQSKNLKWLPDVGVVALTQRTGLIGVGGWGDARLGDFMTSSVQLNDYVYVEELAALSTKEKLCNKLQEMGRESAEYLSHIIPEALSRFEHILILMHVPPFAEACGNRGRRSDPKWLPHYTCGAVGDLMLQVGKENPYHHFTLLCGHVHSAGNVHVLPNLNVKTGGAQYGHPRIQEVFSVL